MAALLSLPLNDRFSVFGKAGVVFADVKSSLSAGAPASLASGDTSSNVVRPLLGIGADYKLSETVDFRADFEKVETTTDDWNDFGAEPRLIGLSGWDGRAVLVYIRPDDELDRLRVELH